MIFICCVEKLIKENAMVNKSNLDSAKRQKQDEFYTLYKDVKNCVKQFTRYFENKTVLSPCNDVGKNFFKFFSKNFDKLKLKRLVALSYLPKAKGSLVILENREISKKSLKGTGDCFSQECIKYLKNTDIVVTNPPFSMFDSFLLLLLRYQKQFLILGPLLSAGHKEIFPLIQNNKLWVHEYLSFIEFSVPDSYEEKSCRFRVDEKGNKFRSFGNICWFTNIPNEKRVKPIKLTSKYKNSLYPKYDNKTNAIEVARVEDIPSNYDGTMGVPITFLAKYCPSQFQIVGFRKGDDGKDLKINGKNMFSRILIKPCK